MSSLKKNAQYEFERIKNEKRENLPELTDRGLQVNSKGGLRKAHLAMCAFGLAASVNIAWMVINLMNYASRLGIGLRIGFTWLLNSDSFGVSP